jgi:transcriptional regulator with XRE-family HTH domain
MNNDDFKKTKGKVVAPTPLPDLTDPFSPSQLGIAIKSQRTNLQLRIIDVAKKCQLSKDTILKIEKGDSTVSLKNILKVAYLLGVSFSIQTDTSNNRKNDNNDWH